MLRYFKEKLTEIKAILSEPVDPYTPAAPPPTISRYRVVNAGNEWCVMCADEITHGPFSGRDGAFHAHEIARNLNRRIAEQINRDRREAARRDHYARS